MSKKPKHTWRITPAYGTGGYSWHLESVRKTDSGGEITHGIGYFNTLKKARAVAAHLSKKPIEFDSTASS